jgi:N-acetylornithine carbamoyltransferase
MSLKHFTNISDLGPSGFEQVLELALDLKKKGFANRFQGKLLGQVFFNPSLRTRTSFEAAMLREGGASIVLEIGAGTWKLESEEGVRMDGDKAEHIKEAAPVLSRYVDALGIRTFSSGISDAEDDLDTILQGFRKYATVPVVSMESAREHPCQGLADMLTLKERFGNLKGLPVTLSWAPHIKPLPKAVPNSFLLSAIAAGCEVRIAHPEGYELAPSVLAEAESYAKQSGGSFKVYSNREEALQNSVCLYPKAWRPNTPELPLELPNWIASLKDFEIMDQKAVLMHCLPTRRGLEIANELLDSDKSVVTDEAENRLHAQRAILHEVWK